MRIAIALALLCATAPAIAQYKIPVAQIGVRNADATLIRKGTALVFDGTTTAGLLNVTHPAAADVRPLAVAERDIATGAAGTGLLLGLSPAQLRLSAPVAAGAYVYVSNASGEFATAPLGSSFVLYKLETAGAAASDDKWGTPVASYPAIVAAPAGGFEIGTTSSPTKMDATPAVIPEMTQTITTHGGVVSCAFGMTLRLPAGAAGVFALYADGMEVAGTRRTASNATAASLDIPVATSGIRSVSSASHVLAVYWAATSGTMTALSTQRDLSCRELN